MRYQKIFKEVLAEIVPSREERQKLFSQVNMFIADLNRELARTRVSAKAVLGGSYAKDTWLSGDYDVDIFVKFNLAHKEQNLSDILERALKKWRHVRIHGSRDYFWVSNGIKYEIVPVLDIQKTDDAENVTDFSPLHVAWVNRKGSRFKNDIRLAKKFCKASNCYGAESYIRGFSGHVLDILVIYYKGIINLLKAARNWKPKVVLDYNNVYKGRAAMMLNKSKIEGPLILVDPVQPGRNAAAALTQENFDRFVGAAKKFLKRPSKEFFVEKTVDFSALIKKGHLILVKVKTLDEKEDVAGTKFVRAFEHVRAQLADFNVKDAGWVWDRRENGVWWFVLGKKQLPAIIDWPGPPLKFSEAVKKFKKIHKKTFAKKGRVWAKVKREETTPEQVLKRVLNSDFVKQRVKKI
ncbi:MAG: nucleotidyltransferase domain-containing protein [Candidatus Woesearchaeota archaeon]